ncbi:hypothetical protein LSG25_11585 [Paralcaligenes sp. KSB-10]|uniref:hypothetical protein n=1 Tax=Paralcaligenes sp. KSB-10 TaxID=2901142 RepID=UPI001E396E97|nr:hypothetical protein [Paralcaligenes sp. KSB-10]UHL62725.1 hypothetical protein LSG25_11585 [Paralcaligenes sp. KSB-10]
MRPAALFLGTPFRVSFRQSLLYGVSIEGLQSGCRPASLLGGFLFQPFGFFLFLGGFGGFFFLGFFTVVALAHDEFSVVKIGVSPGRAEGRWDDRRRGRVFILRYLGYLKKRQVHRRQAIVVFSILPHGGGGVTCCSKTIKYGPD